MNKTKNLVYLSSFLLMFNISAKAVSFTPGSIAGTVTNGDFDMPGVALDYYENETYLRFALYGYRIDRGARYSFDWEGDYWSGSISISQVDSEAGDPGVRMDVLFQHLVLDPLGPEYEALDITGGGTGDPYRETITLFSSGNLPHDGEFDRYEGDLRRIF